MLTTFQCSVVINEESETQAVQLGLDCTVWTFCDGDVSGNVQFAQNTCNTAEEFAMNISQHSKALSGT
jgi:hypothetical protein